MSEALDRQTVHVTSQLNSGIWQVQEVCSGSIAHIIMVATEKDNLYICM